MPCMFMHAKYHFINEIKLIINKSYGWVKIMKKVWFYQNVKQGDTTAYPITNKVNNSERSKIRQAKFASKIYLQFGIILFTISNSL